MGSGNRVYVARLTRMLVLGPFGESFGRVRDVVISISIVRQQPRVLGLVVDLATRRSVFIPMLRVAAIEPNAVTLNTGSVSLRHFEQRPGEVLAMGQVLDTPVKVTDPDLPELTNAEVFITDLGIEQTRTRDFMVTRVAVRTQRRLGRRGPVHVVDWQNVHGLTPSALAMPDQGVAELLNQFAGRKAVDVADAIRGLPPKRRFEVFRALDDERTADILQELPELDQAEVLAQLGSERSADVLEAMDPDDAADLLGVLTPTDAEMLLTRMDPDESDPVRRLLTHSPDTAGGLILLAQNRQENRDRVALAEDRRRAEQTKADTEYLACELAALRLAVGEVATRDYLRHELENLHTALTDQQKKNPNKHAVPSADGAERRAKKSG